MHCQSKVKSKKSLRLAKFLVLLKGGVWSKIISQTPKSNFKEKNGKPRFVPNIKSIQPSEAIQSKKTITTHLSQIRSKLFKPQCPTLLQLNLSRNYSLVLKAQLLKKNYIKNGIVLRK